MILMQINMILLFILLLLSGCAQYKSVYPDTCDIQQPDKDGQGYTKGVFPCKLSHYNTQPVEKKP